MEAIIVAIRTFLEAGGDVLYLIAAATFCMWALIFERLWFINTEHKQAFSILNKSVRIENYKVKK